MTLLNGIPAAATASFLTALCTRANPIAGALTGILIQRVLAPITTPLMDTLENVSESGKTLASSSVAELTQFVAYASTPLMYTQMPNSIDPTIKALVAGSIGYAVQKAVCKPLSEKVGALADLSFKKLTTVSSLSLFALQTFSAWKATSYLQETTLEDSQVTLLLCLALTGHTIASHILRNPSKQQQDQ